ncbi:MAG: hypothetical protein ACE5WD_02875 [Candidatus Aminicenantia bacterium]
MRIRRSILAKIIFSLIIIFLFGFVFQQAFLYSQTKPIQQKEKGEETEELVPSPKNIKESMGIYVYLIWMWLIIFVLIYVLILKIKEADRVHQLKFEESKKNNKEE